MKDIIKEFKKNEWDARWIFLVRYTHMFKDRFKITEWEYNKELSKLMSKWMCIN